MLSCEDLRHFKELFNAFQVPVSVVPDYSKTLDGGAWKEYKQIPPGGTSVSLLQGLKDNQCSMEFRTVATDVNSASALLEKRHGVPAVRLHAPIGLTHSDAFFETLCTQTGVPMPAALKDERGRLIDAMGDAHKYVAQKRALLYGDFDFILPMAQLLTEIGMQIPILASGNPDNGIAQILAESFPGVAGDGTQVMCDTDFKEIERVAEGADLDIVIGNSRGYKTARALGLPMVRVGMPIHDRMGGQRKLHVGYKGALAILDEIANTLIETQQTTCSVGYSNM
jgi:nitrogenase molybdenum-iron protein NifN